LIRGLVHPQQQLKDEPEAKDSEDTEEAQHSQPRPRVLEEGAGHEGGDVGAKPVNSKEGHVQVPPGDARS
jgi:hypothetical protein